MGGDIRYDPCGVENLTTHQSLTPNSIVDSSKYPPELIKSITEDIGAGLVCYLNIDSLETESVPGVGYGVAEDFGDAYQDVFNKIDGWENCIRIDPPESWLSFGIMEGFITSCIPDGDVVKGHLLDAISRKKPFQNFKLVIDGSQYRQQWFDYRQSRLEQLVREQLPTLQTPKNSPA